MQNGALQGITISNKIVELKGYIKDITENNSAIRSAEYHALYAQLQKMVVKYNVDINAIGVISGVKIIYNIPMESFTVHSMIDQLSYINKMIPMFALSREGGKFSIEQLAKFTN